MYLGVLARNQPRERVSTCSASHSTPITPLYVPSNCQSQARASRQRSALARLMPGVLGSELIHSGVGLLLVEPSFDGPPDIVVNAREDALRAPRMSVEVSPAM